ncbi:hypothetical protein M3Y99_00202900 [Aphelenchoides fujianensis]|nr:hypothetical protein M3Y99_00202900 [Aphelenchoides fujianensis]
MRSTVGVRTAVWLFVLLQACLQIAALTHSKALRSRQLGTESQIVSRMFTDYNEHQRPPVREYAEHGAIVVITSIHINRIQWHTHSAEVDLYLRQMWEDSRLSYEVDVREGLHEIAIPTNKKIWTPDTYFGTAIEKNVGAARRRIVVEPTGDVRSSEQKVIEVGVENSIAFPFHNQKTMRFRLASYQYPIEDLVYLWANSPPAIVPVEVSQDLLEGGAYQLSDIYVGDCLGNYTIGVYSCIDVQRATRRLRSSNSSCRPCSSSSPRGCTSGSSARGPCRRTISAAVPFLMFAVLVIFFPQPGLSRSGVGATQVWLLGCLVLTFASFVEYFLGIEAQYEGKRVSQVTSTIDVLSRILFPVVFGVFLAARQRQPHIVGHSSKV